MAKYVLKTSSNWTGEKEHKIEGDFENEDEALEAFGGHDEAFHQAIEDHAPGYRVEEVR